MADVHIVFGPQGAGKSTYSSELAKDLNGVCLSIDQWMWVLFGADMPKKVNFKWVMDRVQRCESQIWSMTTKIIQTGGVVVLDLGFMKQKKRSQFLELAHNLNKSTQMHYLTTPLDIRKKRVMQRNLEKGETFTFEVSAGMFDFMEAEFEPANAQELAISKQFYSTSLD